MSFEFRAGGKIFRIDSNGRGSVRLNGEEASLDFRPLRHGCYSLIVNGRSYEAFVRQEKEGFIVTVEGYLIPVRQGEGVKKEDEKRGGEGPVVVRSPMPGRVIGIEVAVGDPVRADQGLIIVEAMKMENRLLAPRAGKITRIAVKVGETVEAGRELMVLE